MSANKHTGDVPFDLGDGLKGTLRFDWRALSDAQAFLGKSFAGASMENMSPEQVAQLFAIGCRKHNPEITAEKLMDVSPPLIGVIEAISKAAAAAFFGADKLPEAGEADESPKA